MPDPDLPVIPPVGVIPTASCEGYVWKYSIKLPRTPKDKIYFKFTISSKKNEAKDLLEFELRRKKSEVVDQDEQQKLLAISYSSISMAIIATLKDALISGKKVKVEYEIFLIPGPPGAPTGGRRVRSVGLIKE